MKRRRGQFVRRSLKALSRELLYQDCQRLVDKVMASDTLAFFITLCCRPTMLAAGGRLRR